MAVGENPSRPRPLFLRLTVWYATLFIAGAAAIVVLTYFLTQSSLEQRDRQIIQQKLGEYASVYAQGGVTGLADTIRAEQASAPERLFVRVLGYGSQALITSGPGEWNPRDLEIASAQLADGVEIEVGKSTEAREDLLARFRATLGIVTLIIIAIALGGGLLATESALAPVRRLSDAVRRVVDTGRTDARVPLAGTGDALDDLTVRFNEMLDKIEGLVTAMRGALDNVSHDLRTPLTRLRGTAELALAADPDPQRCRDALADCVEESDRVLLMLNTLMDISEAESGAMQLHRAPVAVADVIGRAVDLYHDVADARDITLTASAPADLTVSADRPRLEQVMANLIDNAIKYTGPDGSVDVTASREDGRALLRVRDTGAGIPPDEIPRIWDRLFRGDRSRSERGLGLGLSLVKAIVEAHGGTVTVESEIGRGSTFTVALPLG